MICNNFVYEKLEYYIAQSIDMETCLQIGFVQKFDEEIINGHHHSRCMLAMELEYIKKKKNVEKYVSIFPCQSVALYSISIHEKFPP